MVTETKVKTWGSSLGVVIPRDVVQRKHLRAGEEIILDIRKKRTLHDIFGSLKDWTVDTQKMKDQMRKEWR